MFEPELDDDDDEDDDAPAPKAPNAAITACVIASTSIPPGNNSREVGGEGTGGAGGINAGAGAGIAGTLLDETPTAAAADNLVTQWFSIAVSHESNEPLGCDALTESSKKGGKRPCSSSAMGASAQ